MTATSYRYIFCDLLTNEVLAELPLTGVRFDEKLNEYGNFESRILLSGLDTKAYNVFNATVGGKCAIYVDRNDVLIFGGVLIYRKYKSSKQMLELKAQSFESYLESRLITADVVFTNVDQLSIAASLITTMQAELYGDIGLLYNQDAGSTATSGVLVTQNYYAYEKKKVFQAIQDLSNTETGFDFSITVYYDGVGVPTKSFNTYYPSRGVRYSPSLLTVPVFEMPSGNILDYDYEEDSSRLANRVFALGAGSGIGKVSASADDSAKFADGWALVEDTEAYSDVTDVTQLGSLATGRVNAVSYPPISFVVTLSPTQDPLFGTYKVGDDVRVRITDPFFPEGLDEIYRIVSLAVEAGEDGPERVVLNLTQNTGA